MISSGEQAKVLLRPLVSLAVGSLPILMRILDDQNESPDLNADQWHALHEAAEALKAFAAAGARAKEAL